MRCKFIYDKSLRINDTVTMKFPQLNSTNNGSIKKKGRQLMIHQKNWWALNNCGYIISKVHKFRVCRRKLCSFCSVNKLSFPIKQLFYIITLLVEMERKSESLWQHSFETRPNPTGTGPGLRKNRKRQNPGWPGDPVDPTRPGQKPVNFCFLTKITLFWFFKKN